MFLFILLSWMKKLKIVYLLPPSEGKFIWWKKKKEELSFSFEKPLSIAQNATQKDLKCMGKRFEEWIFLNQNIQTWPFCKTIERYNGVMYNAIWYSSLSKWAQKFFDEHFLIISGMYGILKPQDIIANYKLPIETKWLTHYWGENITQTLNSWEVDIIVDLLPDSYKKMIHIKHLIKKRVEVDFVTYKDGKKVKIAHWVKKLKGELVRKICEEKGMQIGESNKIEIYM